MRLFKAFILLSYAIFTGSVFAQTSIELVKVAGNLNKPLAMVQPTGDSRLFIIEQDGLIKILENGIITGIFLVLYGCLRFLIEFVRVPTHSLIKWGAFTCTRGQLYSLPVCLLGIGIILYSLQMYKRRPMQTR